MSRCVLISGLGLMGGSLAAALSAAGWRVLLHHRRYEVTQAAAARGWGEALRELDQAGAAQLAVVCTPISAIAAQVRAIAAATSALITDVGSTKQQLVHELADLPSRYLGSHPMAGSHLHGLEHATPELYRQRTAIITPTAASSAASVALVSALWQAAGCRVAVLSPEIHDRVVAQASHLPHILASATAAQLSAAAAPVAATGFRDATRIAAAAAPLWADILLSNAPAVLEAIQATQAHVHGLSAALAQGDRAAVEAWLELGVAGRQRFEAVQPPGPHP